MLIGLIIGLLLLTLIVTIFNATTPYVMKPYTTSWVFFGGVGALIGHFVS